MKVFLSQSALLANMHFICMSGGQKSHIISTEEVLTPGSLKQWGFQLATVAVLYFQTTLKSDRWERGYKAERIVR